MFDRDQSGFNEGEFRTREGTDLDTQHTYLHYDVEIIEQLQHMLTTCYGLHGNQRCTWTEC